MRMDENTSWLQDSYIRWGCHIAQNDSNDYISPTFLSLLSHSKMNLQVLKKISCWYATFLHRFKVNIL